MAVTSCFDDKYDLSDIDTNVRVQVKDLTLPINIDQIQLKSIIDLNEDDEDAIVKEINGSYAILREGSFESSALTIDKILVNAPSTHPSTTVFRPEVPAYIKGNRAAGDIAFDIETKETSNFHYEYSNVSKDIVEIGSLGVVWRMSYDVTIQAVNNGTKKFTLSNFTYKLPKGLTGTPSIGSYNPTTGLLSVNNYLIDNGKLNFTMDITAIDAAAAGVVFDTERHYLSINDNSGVENGQIVVAASDIATNGIPTEIRVTTSLVLSTIDIKTFTGKIKYDIDDINIAPVELNDLPDVLAQKGTDIKISNPQIYLNIENPFHAYGVHASTGFALRANRENEAPVVSEINNKTFEISSAAKSFYCLSPTKPETYYEGYASATQIPFSKLSTAMSGNGLPTSIDIDLDPTIVPVQAVNDFVLGSYPAVKGGYVFYAPIALAAGSTIEYTDTEDGWNDEDVDKITITTLCVKALLSNDLPFDIVLDGYPIDKDGNQINNVSIDGAVVKAGAQSEPIDIHISGTVTHLDGIKFTARAVAESNTTALSPNQYIKLNDIRVTVSGYYDDEL
ncbi:MAG: hypothetical protein NC098_07520 [Lachnoclostridium sp.]|nr:hypothetical protein [Lachnoclostridium sp.]